MLAVVHDPYPVAQRPHSTVATYERGDVTVSRLQMSVSRHAHRLRVHVAITAANAGGSAVVRVLRVGRCLGGRDARVLSCPAAREVRLRIAAHRHVGFARTLSIPQPGPATDSIQASFAGVGAHAPYTARTVDAQLLLKGQAWRGENAGRTFGLTSDPRVGRVYLDAAGIDGDTLRVFALYGGPAATDASTTTTLATCRGSACRSERLRSHPDYGDATHFGDRLDVDDDRGAARAELTVAGAGGAPEAEAALPWPR